jgi:PAS domain S-box-containing protein
MIGNAIGRAQLYAELCENETRYRRLVELSPTPILVQSDGRIVFINQAGVRLIAANAPEDVIGIPLLDLIHPDHRARASKAQPPQLPDDVVEETLIRLDRQLIDVEIVSIPTTYLGKAATQVVIRNITERKRSEAERLAFERRLLETQKLESLGVLAGGIAHEFNNLLMGVLGNAALASRELPPDSPVQYSLRSIEGAASRGAELTQQLMVYSGRKQFTLQTADLNQLAEEMIRLARVSFGRNTRLALDLGELPPIEADAAQLRQLILNLLINAAEAIGEASGRLSVSTGVRQLSSAYLATTYLRPNLPSGEYVYFSVADDGPGMDDATQARIFEPFFTTKFPGRGLGLAAALGVMRGQRGALTVHSAPGQGSTFTVYFPSSTAAVSAPSLGETSDQPKLAADTMVLTVE